MLKCKSMYHRTRKYSILLYYIAILLVGLQFLQIFEASVFYRDDPVQIVKYRNLSFKSRELLTRPAKTIFWYLCTLLKDPIRIRFFILSILWLGTICFVYLCNLFSIPPILSLLSLNLSVSYYFNAEAVYFIAGSWATFCWSFSLLSIVLFFISLNLKFKVKKAIIFILSLICYWTAVTRNPQPMLFPLIVIFMGLYFIKRMSGTTHSPIIINNGMGNQRLYLPYLVSYLFLSVGVYLIRWLLIGVQIHNYIKNHKSSVTR